MTDRIRKIERIILTAPSVSHLLDFSGIPIHLVRGYVHISGFSDTYEDVQDAMKHLLYTYENEIRVKGPGHNYAIAIVWGEEREKMADFFLYGRVDTGNEPNLKDWQNAIPSKKTLVTRRGSIIDHPACEDSDILLGAEARYRRTTPNFGDFKKYHPNLESIDLKVAHSKT